jgi:hypothetical protein
MSHDRDRYVNRTRENHRGNPRLEPRYYLDYLPYNFQKVKKNMASSRYVRQTEEEMERLLSEKDSKKNTKRAISTSVKCFRNYLQANGIDQEFESFEAGVLDGRSKEYYASVRKANDEHLKKSTLHTFRYGLKRFLNDSINIDISDTRTFPDSNKMFHAVLVDLKKKGFGKVDYKPPITKEDLTKLYSGSTI